MTGSPALSKLEKIFRLLIVTAALAASCALGASISAVPLPDLLHEPVELRVAYVINPRLPQMDKAQLQLLLDSTKKATRENFGIELQFAAPVEVTIDALFQRIPTEQRVSASRFIYDIKTGKGDPVRFENAFVEGLKHNGDPVEEVLRFARPYLDDPVEGNYDALGKALARIQLQRIERWKQIKALDGSAVIDASPYNEYVLWDSLVRYAGLPYEIMITNQAIVSAEYAADPAVHSALRGGYTNGNTTVNPKSRYGTTSIWSTFAFTSNDPWMLELRDGESYGHEEAARLAGIGAAHEIGHQLFHLGHPFGKTACLMNPVPMFAFRAWIKALSPKDCRSGSHPAMEPGAVTFYVQSP